jgi:hypothetical protein
VLPDPNTVDMGIGLWSHDPQSARKLIDLCEIRSHSLKLYEPLILNGVDGALKLVVSGA